jgi:hypothetical protein
MVILSPFLFGATRAQWRRSAAQAPRKWRKSAAHRLKKTLRHIFQKTSKNALLQAETKSAPACEKRACERPSRNITLPEAAKRVESLARPI